MDTQRYYSPLPIILYYISKFIDCSNLVETLQIKVKVLSFLVESSVFLQEYGLLNIMTYLLPHIYKKKIKYINISNSLTTN